jgi:drug/metabolite transporter superfamily protein YnfA
MDKPFQKSSQLQNNAYAIAWALFILFACGAPSSTFETLQLKDILGYDKPIHAILFGTQSYLLIRVLRNKRPQAAMVTYACLAGVAYGVLIEFMQKFYFEGRAYDYFDMLANSFGCMLVWLWFKRKSAIRNQHS